MGTAQESQVDIRAIELDVQSQNSVDAAIRSILEAEGRLEVVVHNAGHLSIGYAEAFTAADITELFDVNVLGMQRVNRAVLPHMRERGSGTLVYVGSTSTIDLPPFMAAYVASKSAFDALAQLTAYEVSAFGIESTIVMPGAFTRGTEHFANASRASDQKVAGAYARFEGMVGRYEQATEGLFGGVDADPPTVAAEIGRILALPRGSKPARAVLDFTQSHVEQCNEVLRQEQAAFLSRMGFGELLTLGGKTSVH